jgi:opacity protein-like surface antigen
MELGNPQSATEVSLEAIMMAAQIGALLFLIVPALCAQDYTKKGELYGQIGLGVTYDDEGRIGNGFAAGGGVGYRFTPRLGAEFDINAFRHERNVAAGQILFRGAGQFFTGNLVFHFKTGRVQPYVLAGAGGLLYDNQSFLGPAKPPQTRFGFAGDFGSGVKFFVNEHWSIRPEVRYYTGANPRFGAIEGPVSNLRVSVGVGYHW